MSWRSIIPIGAVITMKKEYDFSKGVRGKFYRPNARFESSGLFR